MNSKEDILKKIIELSNGSSEYHFLCAEYFKILAKETTDKEQENTLLETAELHKAIGNQFK